MSTVLQEICEKKRDHIAQCQQDTSLEELEHRAQEQTPPRGFIQALKRRLDDGEYGLIAEIKKASPSKGVIRQDFNPPALAQAYESGGAACLSVLTDTPYFQGHNEYLTMARNACRLPVLRKDFILAPYQVVEARAIGADCILLIMAALSPDQAAELEATAHNLGMDVLIEIHDGQELEQALKLKTKLIGINNRNLKSLDVDLNISIELSRHIPPDRIAVCESGLKTQEDLKKMSDAGMNCFLIGESLMRQTNVETATRRLLSKKI